MNQSFFTSLFQRNPVIPLLRLERLGDALPLVEALQEGGIQAIEVWMPHSGAHDLLYTLREHCTDITVGAGGVMTASDVKQARALGVHYVSCPGLSPTVLQACAKLKLPCLPAVGSTSELLLAREMGITWLMAYPACLPALRTLAQHWYTLDANCHFIAQGGMTQADAAQWLEMPNVAGVYADWLFDDEDLLRRQWRIITERARRAVVMPTLRNSARTATGSGSAV